MSIEKDIQEQFYKTYKGLISVSEFEEWLYNTPEIEKVYGDDFYFNLLDLNYRDRHIKNELVKVIEVKISFGEFEQMRIVSLLENIICEKGDLVEVLEEIYDDYCRGYYFLRYLALNYVTEIDDVPKLQQKEKWDKNEFNSKREILKNIKPKMVNEARRLLSFFQNGLLKITAENEYDDYRTEEERVELNNFEKMFSDAIDHMNKIEGNVSNLANADLKKLPRPLKYFGYFMAGFFSISILLILILNLLK